MEDQKKKERRDGVEWHVRRATSLSLARIHAASVISLRFTFISLPQETKVISESSIICLLVQPWTISMANAHRL